MTTSPLTVDATPEPARPDLVGVLTGQLAACLPAPVVRLAPSIAHRLARSVTAAGWAPRASAGGADATRADRAGRDLRKVLTDALQSHAEQSGVALTVAEARGFADAVMGAERAWAEHHEVVSSQDGLGLTTLRMSVGAWQSLRVLLPAPLMRRVDALRGDDPSMIEDYVLGRRMSTAHYGTGDGARQAHLAAAEERRAAA